MMDTLVLCGGPGYQLGNITDIVPKVILPVLGRAPLSYALEKIDNFYRHADIEGRCYLAVESSYESHLKNYLEEYTHRGFSRPLEILIDPEENEFEEIGVLKDFKDKITTNHSGLMVIGADNIFSLDLENLFNEYNSAGECTINAVFDLGCETRHISNYGQVWLDDNSVKDGMRSRGIIGFKEKGKSFSHIVSAAVYIFNNQSLERLDDYFKTSFYAYSLGEFIKWLADNPLQEEKREVIGYEFEGYWADTGSFKSYEGANQLLAQCQSKIAEGFSKK